MIKTYKDRNSKNIRMSKHGTVITIIEEKFSSFEKLLLSFSLTLLPEI